jgi:hypothetical protein
MPPSYAAPQARGVLLEAAQHRRRRRKALGVRRVRLLGTAGGPKLSAASAHPGTTHTRGVLNLGLSTCVVDHYDQVHILLRIKEAGIKLILVSAKVEHVITFGDKPT